MLNKGNLAKLAFLGLLFLAPLFVTKGYHQHVLIMIFLYIILSLSVRMMMLIGQPSIGHSAFAAIGGYTSAALSLVVGIPVWPAMLLGGLAAAIIGLAVGIPTLRVTGGYFVILTIGIVEVVRICFRNFWIDIFGGSNGLIGVPSPSIAGIELGFENKVGAYYLILALALIVLLVMYRWDKSRLGLTSHAIMHTELLAKCVGVNPMRHKLLAFCISCFIAGIAGSFFAHYTHIIHPGCFDLMLSIYLLIYCVVGGLGSVFGTVIGVFVLASTAELLRPVPQLVPLIYGGILMLVILVTPEGFLGLPERVSLLIRKVRKIIKVRQEHGIT